MEYQHSQIATVIIVPMILVFIIAAVMLPAYQVFNNPVLIVGILLLIALALFYDLKVEIRNNTITCKFGIGVIQRQIPILEIKEAKAVKNPWYAGWGIRWLPGQYWLWNASGFDAVELLFKDGRRFRIGTDEPEKLVAAIKLNQSTIL